MIKWTRDDPTMWTGSDPAKADDVELVKQNNAADDEATWCVRIVDAGCTGLHVKGLKKAKRVGTRLLYGYLKHGKKS